MSVLSSLFGKKNKPIDSDIEAYLTTQFGLDPADIADWRVTYSKTTFASQNVDVFRVFDPAQTSEPAKKVSYESLSGAPEALKFEGQIGANGAIGQIHDVRQVA